MFTARYELKFSILFVCISWYIRNCLRDVTCTCLLAKLNVVLRAAYNHGAVINAHCEKS